MKKILIPIFILCLSLLFTACANSDTQKQDNSETEKTEEKALTHPGQYLTDKVSSFKIGDKEFTPSLNYDGFKEVFGDEMAAIHSGSDEGSGEHNSDSIYDNKILAFIVQDGVYCADIDFAYDENLKKFSLWHFHSVFDYGDKETFDKIQGISYIENGEVKEKDFPIEVDKVVISVGDLTTGTATREQVEQYFGSGIYESGDTSAREMFAFEDYTLGIYFDSDDIFRAISLRPTHD